MESFSTISPSLSKKSRLASARALSDLRAGVAELLFVEEFLQEVEFHGCACAFALRLSWRLRRPRIGHLNDPGCDGRLHSKLAASSVLPRPRVVSRHRIRTQRACAGHSSVGHLRGDNLARNPVMLNPVHQRPERVKHVRAGPPPQWSIPGTMKSLAKSSVFLILSIRASVS